MSFVTHLTDCVTAFEALQGTVTYCMYVVSMLYYVTINFFNYHLTAHAANRSQQSSLPNYYVTHEQEYPEGYWGADHKHRVCCELEAVSSRLMRRCGAVWCSVVQCGAVWCSVLQCVAVCCSTHRVCGELEAVSSHLMRWCGAVWCSVLQCAAVCCSVVQYPLSLR